MPAKYAELIYLAWLKKLDSEKRAARPAEQEIIDRYKSFMHT